MVGGQESEQARIANGLLARFEGEPYIIQPDLLAERLPWQFSEQYLDYSDGVRCEI